MADQAARELVSMGFTEDQASTALAVSNGDLSAAINLLLEQPPQSTKSVKKHDSEGLRTLSQSRNTVLREFLILKVSSTKIPKSCLFPWRWALESKCLGEANKPRLVHSPKK